VTYSLNLAYDAGAGFQDCGGGCANGSGCGMNVKYYNNTAYISGGNSYALYADGTCGGSSSSSQADVRNNIFDGSQVVLRDMNTVTENYNDIGGAQGNGGFDSQSGEGSQDMNNTNPDYVDAGVAPPKLQLRSGSPLSNAGQSGLTSNHNIGAY
jgi:hypothetical protein